MDQLNKLPVYLCEQSQLWLLHYSLRKVALTVVEFDTESGYDFEEVGEKIKRAEEQSRNELF